MDGRDSDQRRRPGRPSEGANLVASLATGTPVAKARLESILRTLSGEWTVEEACARLAISRSRFHEMRTAFLEGATTLLEPKRPGPKRAVESVDATTADALQEQVDSLEIEVIAAQVRADLVLTGSTGKRAESTSQSRPGKRGKKRRRRGR